MDLFLLDGRPRPHPWIPLPQGQFSVRLLYKANMITILLLLCTYSCIFLGFLCAPICVLPQLVLCHVAAEKSPVMSSAQFS